MGMLCMPGWPSEYCPDHPAPMYCITDEVHSVSAGPGTFPCHDRLTKCLVGRVCISGCMAMQGSVTAVPGTCCGMVAREQDVLAVQGAVRAGV